MGRNNELIDAGSTEQDPAYAAGGLHCRPAITPGWHEKDERRCEITIQASKHHRNQSTYSRSCSKTKKPKDRDVLSLGDVGIFAFRKRRGTHSHSQSESHQRAKENWVAADPAVPSLWRSLGGSMAGHISQSQNLSESRRFERPTW